MKLTKREEAILQWAAVTGCDDWKNIYLFSRDGAIADFENKARLQRDYSYFKNRSEVQRFYNLKAFEFSNYLQNERKEAVEEHQRFQNESGKLENRNEIESEKGAKEFESRFAKKTVDFTDREQTVKFLNKVVNTTQDEGVRRDYLKLITDIQGFKQNVLDNKKEVERFYMPLKCLDCDLYKLGKKRLETGMPPECL